MAPKAPRSRVSPAARVCAALLSVSMLSTLVTPAFAQPSPADRETARGLMASGRERRERKDLRGALDAFVAADAIMHVPTTGYEVAATQVALGLLVEARETLLAIQRTPAQSGEPLPFAEARRRADALNTFLEERIPSLTIALEGGSPNSIVTVDGEPIPSATMGQPRRLNPGRHIVVAADGPARDEKELVLAAGERRTLSLQLRAPAASAVTDAATGTSVPYALVETGDTGEAQGTRRPVQAVTWIALGLSAAAAGAGAVTGVLAFSATRTAQAECVDGKCPPGAHTDVDRANAYATASTIAFAGAGATAAVALVTFLLRPSVASESTARVTPISHPGGAGLRVTF